MDLSNTGIDGRPPSPTYVAWTRVRVSDTSVFLRVGHLKLKNREYLDLDPKLSWSSLLTPLQSGSDQLQDYESWLWFHLTMLRSCFASTSDLLWACPIWNVLGTIPSSSSSDLLHSQSYPVLNRRIWYISRTRTHVMSCRVDTCTQVFASPCNTKSHA